MLRKANQKNSIKHIFSIAALPTQNYPIQLEIK